jgi:hypothetical protein
MERVKIKERVKGWRGWREYMGVVRQQSAMVAIFMHKKSVLERRRITIAWKDQVRYSICHVCIFGDVARNHPPESALRCGTRCWEKSGCKCSKWAVASFGKT